MSRSRLRCARGASLLETVIVAGLLTLALAGVLYALTAGQRSERVSTRFAEAVTEARHGLDALAREVREADDLTSVPGSNVVVAWYDGDADETIDLGEQVVYSIDAVGGRLLRVAGTETRVLARGLDGATSTLSVSTVRVNVKLVAVLRIDVDPTTAPGITEVRTEVLARNAAA